MSHEHSNGNGDVDAKVWHVNIKVLKALCIKGKIRNRRKFLSRVLQSGVVVHEMNF